MWSSQHRQLTGALGGLRLWGLWLAFGVVGCTRAEHLEHRTWPSAAKAAIALAGTRGHRTKVSVSDVPRPLRETELQEGHPKPEAARPSFLSIRSHPPGQSKHTDSKVEHKSGSLTFKTQGNKYKREVHTEA